MCICTIFCIFKAGTYTTQSIDSSARILQSLSAYDFRYCCLPNHDKNRNFSLANTDMTDTGFYEDTSFCNQWRVIYIQIDNNYH